MRASSLALVLLISARASFAADDAPLALRLVPEPAAEVSPLETAKVTPLYKRWYFWASIGVVATAVTAVAVGLAVGAANQPPRVSQREVCGGPCDATLGL